MRVIEVGVEDEDLDDPDFTEQSLATVTIEVDVANARKMAAFLLDRITVEVIAREET